MVQSAGWCADGPLRVGVVGVGVMGSNHARVFADLPGVTLVGVADPDGKQCDFVSAALGCAAGVPERNTSAHNRSSTVPDPTIPTRTAAKVTGQTRSGFPDASLTSALDFGSGGGPGSRGRSP